MLQELIKYLKPQEEAFPNHQLSPLYACVGSFQGSCVRFILDVLNGKNFNVEKARENTAGAGTKVSSSLSSWRPLLDRPSHSSDMGLTPLIRAASGGDAAIVRMLLENGADANRTCKLGDGQVSAKDMAQDNEEINGLLDEAIAKKTVVEGGQ